MSKQVGTVTAVQFQQQPFFAEWASGNTIGGGQACPIADLPVITDSLCRTAEWHLCVGAVFTEISLGIVLSQDSLRRLKNPTKGRSAMRDLGEHCVDLVTLRLTDASHEPTHIHLQFLVR